MRKAWLRAEIGHLEQELKCALDPGWSGYELKGNLRMPVNKLQYIADVEATLRAHRREMWIITREEWVLRFKKFWGVNV